MIRRDKNLVLTAMDKSTKTATIEVTGYFYMVHDIQVGLFHIIQYFRYSNKR